MNQRCIILWCLLLFAANADAQFYFRGEVKDLKANGIAHVRIHIHSTNSFYYSGTTGAFGIPSSKQIDTVSFYLKGFEEKTLVLNSNEFNSVVLNMSSVPGGQKRKLLSVTRNRIPDRSMLFSSAGETYSQQSENGFNYADQYPTTGFALDVDKASYSNIRRFLNMQSEPPADAVRIEEMLNYFPQKYTEPPNGKTFHVQSQLTDCSWNRAHHLLFLQLQAKKINYDFLPPSNFVFLVDVSGSMEQPNRLPLLKTAFRLMVQNLRPIDTISMVIYGGTVGVALRPTSGKEKEKIMAVIDSLSASGDTPGPSAIRQAYTLAERTFIKGGNNRIILATDGDFNVGEVSEEALIFLISQKQKTGIYLTCLGVGMGNYKDSKLEVLAKKGNGNFAYLDNVMEAEKVLVKELTQTLYAVANEAFLNVTFQPKYVKQYRLIGYDNRKDVLADSSSLLEGGEVGTGNTVTAVFEVELTDVTMPLGEIIANAELSYQCVESQDFFLEQYPLSNNYSDIKQADSTYRFAAAVAMFGMLLKKSAYLKEGSWEELIKMLQTCINKNDYWQNEMLMLVQKAKEIYKPTKSRKGLFKRKKSRDDL